MTTSRVPLNPSQAAIFQAALNECNVGYASLTSRRLYVDARQLHLLRSFLLRQLLAFYASR